MEILTPWTVATLWKPYEVRKSNSSPSLCFLGRDGALKTMEEILGKLGIITDFLEYV